MAPIGIATARPATAPRYQIADHDRRSSHDRIARAAHSSCFVSKRGGRVAAVMAAAFHRQLSTTNLFELGKTVPAFEIGCKTP